MKKILIVIALLVFISHAQAGVWTTLDYPGSMRTQITGIDGSNIVGQYESGSGTHGFLFDGTTWTTLDMPGVQSGTHALDIDGDKIVGWYFDSVYGNRGFVYDGTIWSTLDGPGDNFTSAYGIDGDNIVGFYHSEGKAHGSLYDGTSWTTLDAPWATTEYTFLTGINGNNIVGYCADHGFIYDGTTWSILDMPGAYSTNIMDIDGSNIVGYYNGSSGAGFLYDGTTWIDLTMPGATDNTRPSGISGNNIVGYYTSTEDGRLHGFLYTVPEPGTLLLLAFGIISPRFRRFTGK